MSLISEFLTTSFQNVRSKERTNRLHKAVLNEILNVNPEFAELRWEFEYELSEDAFGGTFDLDIVGFDDNDEIKVVILVKAMNSNVNKNIKNYANTTIGEAARLYHSPLAKNCKKILFVSLLPRVAPMFTTAGEIRGFDNVVAAKGRTKIDHILRKQYNGVVEAIDLFYDIEDVRMKKHKSDFNEIKSSNLDKLVIS